MDEHTLQCKGLISSNKTHPEPSAPVCLLKRTTSLTLERLSPATVNQSAISVKNEWPKKKKIKNKIISTHTHTHKMRRLNVININTPTGSVRFLRLPPAVMDARITEPSVDIYLEIVRLRTGFHGRQRLYGRLGHFDLHHLSRPRQRGTHTDMGLRRSKRGAANTSTFSQGETRRRRGRQPKHTESAFKNPPPRK